MVVAIELVCCTTVQILKMVLVGCLQAAKRVGGGVLAMKVSGEQYTGKARHFLV